MSLATGDVRPQPSRVFGGGVIAGESRQEAQQLIASDLDRRLIALRKLKRSPLQPLVVDRQTVSVCDSSGLSGSGR